MVKHLPKNELVLNTISKVIVQNNAICLASSANQILIDVGGVNSVKLSNSKFIQDAKSNANCIQESNIKAGSDMPNLKKTLMNMLASKTKSKDAKSKFVTNIVESLKSKNISTCLSNAVNLYKTKIKAAKGGDVDITNLNINQVSQGEIKKCLQGQHISMGTISLNQYLKNNLKDYEVKEEYTCDNIIDIKHTATIITAFGVLFIISLILICIFYKFNKSRR